jgi:hypothetical protein
MSWTRSRDRVVVDPHDQVHLALVVTHHQRTGDDGVPSRIDDVLLRIERRAAKLGVMLLCVSEEGSQDLTLMVRQVAVVSEQYVGGDLISSVCNALPAPRQGYSDTNEFKPEPNAVIVRGVVAVDVDIEKPGGIREPIIGVVGWKAIHFRANRNAVLAHRPQRIDRFLGAEPHRNCAGRDNFVEDVSGENPLLRHLA